jgi:hypothetical protein
MDNTEISMTEFNSNKATLMRVDNALKLCSQASISNDYDLWFKGLRILKNEVVVKLKPEEKDECIKLFLRLENKLSVFFNSRANKSPFFTKIDNDLDAYEIFLRDKMNKRGMLLKDSEPDLRGL